MFLRFWLVAALSICPPVLSPVLADPLPMLTLAEREAWTAVGRVNSAGYRKLKACTGTLIAPDLVLTAAHCAGLTADGTTSLHFVAGYDRGRYIAHRTISSSNEHPLYSRTEGDEELRFDVAVLRLDAPIPPEIISPAELIDDGDGGGAKAILLGYHNIRPHVLNGREDCALLMVWTAPPERHRNVPCWCCLQPTERRSHPHDDYNTRDRHRQVRLSTPRG